MARKITIDAVNAFLNNRPFSRDNTTVIIRENQIELCLHGSCIAYRTNDGLFIRNAGVFTKTTRERLNGIPGVSIVQRAGIWYLNGKEWNGHYTKISL